jgi:hypothetical protein
MQIQPKAKFRFQSRHRIGKTEIEFLINNGNGEPLTVDASSVRIEGVYSTDFDGVGDTIPYRTKIISDQSDFLVYGTVTLEYQRNNQIRILRDRYDFDIQEGRFFRNVETVVGGAYAGQGQSYYIHFNGTVDIEPRYIRSHGRRGPRR